jgi:hypothetical protein
MVAQLLAQDYAQSRFRASKNQLTAVNGQPGLARTGSATAVSALSYRPALAIPVMLEKTKGLHAGRQRQTFTVPGQPLEPGPAR